jgi:uncharacterized damage-inducible protein DinB
MTETPQQYAQRVLGYLQGREPLEILEHTPSKLAKLVAGQPDSRLSQPPEPGKWSVRQILAHLADTEMVLGFRTRLMLGDNGVTIQGFDQDKWAAFTHYERVPIDQSLERIRVQRAANLALMRSLSPEQWEHYGMHTERGRETVAHVCRLWAGHDLNHLKQVEKILAG